MSWRVCLQNNPNAFQLTEHQKLEGAQALHMEETRVKMMMAIGQIPPMNEAGMLHHLHEFAVEVGQPNGNLAPCLAPGQEGLQQIQVLVAAAAANGEALSKKWCASVHRHMHAVVSQ